MGIFELGLKPFVAMLFIVFALIMLGISAWAYSILPANCPQNKLRNYLTGTICASVVLLTTFLGYFICQNMCYIKGDSHEINIWVYVFAFFTAVFLTIAHGLTIGEFTDSSNSVCTTGSSANVCIKVLQYSLPIPIIVTIVLGVILYTYVTKDRKKASDEKSKYMEAGIDEEDVKKAAAANAEKEELAARAIAAEKREKDLKKQLEEAKGGKPSEKPSEKPSGKPLEKPSANQSPQDLSDDEFSVDSEHSQGNKGQYYDDDESV